jgi:hypothetical protein
MLTELFFKLRLLALSVPLSLAQSLSLSASLIALARFLLACAGRKLETFVSVFILLSTAKSKSLL